MLDIENERGHDPLHIELARRGDINSKEIDTGTFIVKIGGYSALAHYMTECLLYLNLSGTCWKILVYLLRNITGNYFGSRKHKFSNLKTYIKEKPVLLFMKEMHIKGVRSFYDSRNKLVNMRIIEIRDKKIFLNFLPLTWNIENREAREGIKRVMEDFIEKSKKND